MRSYQQLNQVQRYQIEILKKAGKNQKNDSGVTGLIASHDMPRFEAE